MSGAEVPHLTATSADEPPLLKYQRLGGSVPGILASDTATCLGVHSNFLVLGTGSGALHVLDRNGNESRRFAPHSAAVNGVSIDVSGERVGSCSQDGTVVLSNLLSGASSTQWSPRPVLAISLLEPDSTGRRAAATGGLAGQLVLSTRGWFGSKDVVLHAGEGPVTAVACAGSLVAWANDEGVKVFDTGHHRRVSYVDRGRGAPPPDLFRCQLQWSSPAELLIGWADTIKVGAVRLRDGAKYLEVLTVLQLDFYVCGLTAVVLRPDPTGETAGAPDILALAYVPEAAGEDGSSPGIAPAAPRPELRLLSRQNDEFLSDSLPISGFENLRPTAYALAAAPMDFLPPAALFGGATGDGKPRGGTDAEASLRLPAAVAPAIGSPVERAANAACTGRQDGNPPGAPPSIPTSSGAWPPSPPAAPAVSFVGYVLAPRDIVVARSLGPDDRISWLLSRNSFDQALFLAVRHRAALTRHSPLGVAEAYARAVLARTHGGAGLASELHPDLDSEELRPDLDSKLRPDLGSALHPDLDSGAGREETGAREPAPSSRAAGPPLPPPPGISRPAAAHAASVLASHMGTDTSRWRHWLHAMGAVGCARDLAALLPLSPPLPADSAGPTLHPNPQPGFPSPSASPYEVALCLLVTEEPGTALGMLRRWPAALWREPIVREAAVAALSARTRTSRGGAAPDDMHSFPRVGAAAVSVSKSGALTSTSEITSSAGENAPSAAEVASSAGEIASPAGEIASPAGEIASPAGEIAPPVGEIASPAGEIASPAGEIAPFGGEVESALTEFLAVLAQSRGDAPEAVSLLLCLPPPRSLAAFDLLRGDASLARSQVGRLCVADWPLTLQLLLEEADAALPPSEVVPQLQEAKSDPPGLWLHEYLDGLFTLGSPASLPFHHLQPSLYASHAPGRLLAFLRASQAYRPDQALAEARRVADVDSQALLLCRMGRHPQALALLLDGSRLPSAAIDFAASAHDPQLWPLLLDRAMGSPDLLHALLARLRVSPPPGLDPLALLRRLPDAQALPQLRPTLLAVLRQAGARTAVLEAAVAAAEADRADAIARRHAALCAGVVVEPEG